MRKHSRSAAARQGSPNKAGRGVLKPACALMGDRWSDQPPSCANNTPLCLNFFFDPKNPHLHALGFELQIPKLRHPESFMNICWGKLKFLSFLSFFGAIPTTGIKGASDRMVPWKAPNDPKTLSRGILHDMVCLCCYHCFQLLGYF